ncbi:restriction endonuclease subunit S [Sinorhizobium sp. 22678]|uniref:restriction endonuclease subunit S n=1 Tax=Sinorhizobium sp. 22678 TaxID=3453955 RepID=UPI003F831D0C
MSAHSYESYQDSGTEWLGQVPSHWRLRRLGYYFQERREKVSDKEYPALSVTKNGVVPQLETAAKTDDGDNRKKVMAGDFVINSRSDRKGSSGIAEQHGSVSLINTVLIPLPEIRSRFVHYLLRSTAFHEEFYRYGKGIVADLWSTNYSDMKAITLAVPPLPEQTAIAAYLDRETGKIDALVEEQQRLIDLLKEKRQAVISHAVTKGLNLNAPMKDTGIEWIGEVPEHWERIQLGKLCLQVSDGPHFSPQYTDDGVMFLSARNIKVDGWSLEDAKYISEEDCAEFDRRVVPEKGDILYTKGGTTGIARVVDLDHRFQVWVHVAVLKVNRSIGNPHYIAHALNSVGGYEQSQLYTQGATNKDLGLTRLVKIWLALPPLHEQAEIASYLEHGTSRVDSLIGEAEDAIELLRERRSALISAAVTGKIDVRGQSTSTVVTPDFRQSQKLVAAKIVEELSGQKTFGRVKLQKLLYLAEAHGGIHELSGHYVREAAGPLDREMVREVETALQASGHVVIEQPEGRGTAVNYQLRGMRGAFQTELETLLGDRISALSEIIETVGALDTRGAEAVATLYAAWNDALASGTVPSDDEIIREVLNEWHPKKAETFTVADLKHWLAWMRRNGLKPKGNAPVTNTGRLFV